MYGFRHLRLALGARRMQHARGLHSHTSLAAAAKASAANAVGATPTPTAAKRRTTNFAAMLDGLASIAGGGGNGAEGSGGHPAAPLSRAAKRHQRRKKQKAAARENQQAQKKEEEEEEDAFDLPRQPDYILDAEPELPAAIAGVEAANAASSSPLSATAKRAHKPRRPRPAQSQPSAADVDATAVWHSLRRELFGLLYCSHEFYKGQIFRSTVSKFVVLQPQWKEWRTEADQLLDKLWLALATDAHIQTTENDWRTLMGVLLHFRLYEHWRPCLRALETIQQRQKPMLQLQMGFVVQLVQCATLCEVEPKGEPLEGEPTHLRGPDLSEWLLQRPTTAVPGGTLVNPSTLQIVLLAFAERVQPIDASAPASASDSSGVTALSSNPSLSRARRYYDSIPAELRTEVTHHTMTKAYLAAGERFFAAAEQFRLEVLKHNPTALRASLRMCLDLIEAQMRVKMNKMVAAGVAAKSVDPPPVLPVPAEVAVLWNHAKSAPRQCLNREVMSAFLRLHLLTNDMNGAFTFINEALALEERVVAKEGKKDASSSSSPSSAAAPSASLPSPTHSPPPAAPFVLVDSSQVMHLFDACAKQRDGVAGARRYVPEAEALFERMKARFDVEKLQALQGRGQGPQKLSPRLKEMGSFMFLFSAYMKLLQRAHQVHKLSAHWSLLSAQEKGTNFHLFLVMLNELCPSGDTEGARALVAEMRQFKPLDAKTVAAWLAVCERHGECEEAERIWAEMTEAEVQPTSYLYTKMVQVYFFAAAAANTAGDDAAAAAHLAKVEPLILQMTHGVGAQAGVDAAGSTSPVLPSVSHPPLHFTVLDFNKLLKTAQKCELEAQMRVLAQQAVQMGVMEKLEPVARKMLWRTLDAPVVTETH